MVMLPKALCRRTYIVFLVIVCLLVMSIFQGDLGVHKLVFRQDLSPRKAPSRVAKSKKNKSRAVGGTVPPTPVPSPAPPTPVPLTTLQQSTLAWINGLSTDSSVDRFFVTQSREHLQSWSDLRLVQCYTVCKPPECWSNSVGRCVPNPFFAEVTTVNPTLPMPLPCVTRYEDKNQNGTAAGRNITDSKSRTVDVRHRVLPSTRPRSWREKVGAFQRLTSVGLPLVPWGFSDPSPAGPQERGSGRKLSTRTNRTENNNSTTAHDHRPQMTGRHEPVAGRDHNNHNYYRIRNMCLSAVGPMRGHRPVMDEYAGMDETFPLNGDESRWMNPFKQWLSRTEDLKDYVDEAEDVPRRMRLNNTTSLSQSLSQSVTATEEDEEEPLPYLDTKLMIMPVMFRASNPMHTWHRLVMMNAIRDEVWGGVPQYLKRGASSPTNSSTSSGISDDEKENGEQPEGFATAYVFPDDHVHDAIARPPRVTQLAQTAFYQTLGTLSRSSFVLYGNRDPTKEQVAEYLRWEEREKPTPGYRPAPPESERRALEIRKILRRPLACFKEAVVWSNCVGRNCPKYNGGSWTHSDFKQTVFSIHSRRSNGILKKTVDRLRACMSLQERKSARSGAEGTEGVKVRSV